jgi:hypothetical protein
MLPGGQSGVGKLDTGTLDETTTEAASIATSPEFALLLEACAEPPDPPRLQLACSRLQVAHWERLLALADEHGVTALLYLALTKHGETRAPSAITSELERRYNANVHKSLLQARELFRVLDALETAGISAIPYKGVVLSELAYGDLAIRQAGDIDLLVRTEDVPQAQFVAERLGYTPCLPLSEAELRRYLTIGYEMSFDYGKHRNLLELKWNILPRFYAVDFDMEEMLSAHASTPFAGGTIRSLALEDLFLVLCVHASKHCWSHLIWLCDISRLLSQVSLDWAQIAAKARDLGIVRVVRTTLGLANQLLRAPIPPSPALDPSGDPAAGSLVREIATRIVTGVWLNPESLAYFRLMARMRERPGDRICFISRLAFTPGPNEWNAVKLPRQMNAFYRFVRVWRLSRRLLGVRS